MPALLSFCLWTFRLIQYPLPPCRGRIAVTKEDLACLDSGVFLNDVIIDFYLKSVSQSVVVLASGR